MKKLTIEDYNPARRGLFGRFLVNWYGFGINSIILVAKFRDISRCTNRQNPVKSVLPAMKFGDLLQNRDQKVLGISDGQQSTRGVVLML